jgi:putative DNA primase/helicase
VLLDNIPEELRRLPQWVGWSYAPRADRQAQVRWTKVPLDLGTGRLARANDPATWVAFDVARAVLANTEEPLDGIGFMFSDDDPFAGVDFDDAYRDGALCDWARPLVAALDSYTEVSPSGTGVKVYLRGRLSGERHRKAYGGGEVELYDRLRFFCVTGQHLPDTPRETAERQTQLEEMYRTVFKGTHAPVERVFYPFPQAERVKNPFYEMEQSDDELVRRAGTGRGGPRFRALWSGDTGGYRSASEADLALCGLLAFWCDGDGDRIDALFRRSGLYRPKWDEQRGRFTYGARTIGHALSSRSGRIARPGG